MMYGGFAYGSAEYAGGGFEIIYSSSVFDAVSIAENLAQTQVFNTGLVFDAVSIAEDVSLLKILFVSSVDTVSIAEAVLQTQEFTNGTVIDSITILESVTLDLTALQSVSDAIAIMEAVELGRSVLFSIADSIAITEDTTQSVSAFPSLVFDSLTIAEAVLLALEALITVTDAVSIDESTEQSVSTIASVSDAVVILEDVSTESIRFSPERPLDKPRGYSDVPFQDWGKIRPEELTVAGYHDDDKMETSGTSQRVKVTLGGGI